MIAKILDFLVFHLFYLSWRFAGKKKRKDGNPRLLWGPDPLINNKYWSECVSGDYESHTIMSTYFPVINRKEDFNYYIDEIRIGAFRELLCRIVKPALPWIRDFFVFNYLLSRYDIFHFSFNGGFLRRSRYWRKEAFILKRHGKKAVIIPYGGDFFVYRRVRNLSYLHGLLYHYPKVNHESEWEERVAHWENVADCVIPGFLVDGAGRWDVLPFSSLVLDVKKWMPAREGGRNNGRNGPVVVAHSPNHRKIKGTQFVIAAVERLRSEGYQIEFILMEKMQNEKVKEILCGQVDVFVEQVILSGIGMSAVEAMAAGIPVISSLEETARLELFRRYSYLEECPVISANPETIYEVLKQYVENPELRLQAGRKSRQYAEKYHSYDFGKYLFGKIYDKLWYRKDLHLLDIFDNLNPAAYNHTLPKINVS
jgi:hypothetical protein